MALGKKTGGRQKGTPNKENPLKGYIRSHSLAYFEPKPQVEADGKSPRVIKFRDKDGMIIDTIVLESADGSPLCISDFDVDMLMMQPHERVFAELRLLKFHMPEMKAIDMDMTVTDSGKTIEDRLAELARDDDDGDE